LSDRIARGIGGVGSVAPRWFFQNAASRLAQRVSIGYTLAMKGSGLRIRIERDLREKFLATCREQDRPAAQVLREFMRAYVNQNETGQTAKGKQA